MYECNTTHLGGMGKWNAMYFHSFLSASVWQVVCVVQFLVFKAFVFVLSQKIVKPASRQCYLNVNFIQFL